MPVAIAERELAPISVTDSQKGLVVRPFTTADSVKTLKMPDAPNQPPTKFSFITEAPNPPFQLVVVKFHPSEPSLQVGHRIFNGARDPWGISLPESTQQAVKPSETQGNYAIRPLPSGLVVAEPHMPFDTGIRSVDLPADGSSGDRVDVDTKLLKELTPYLRPKTTVTPAPTLPEVSEPELPGIIVPEFPEVKTPVTIVEASTGAIDPMNEHGSPIDTVDRGLLKEIAPDLRTENAVTTDPHPPEVSEPELPRIIMPEFPEVKKAPATIAEAIIRATNFMLERSMPVASLNHRRIVLLNVLASPNTEGQEIQADAHLSKAPVVAGAEDLYKTFSAVGGMPYYSFGPGRDGIKPFSVDVQRIDTTLQTSLTAGMNPDRAYSTALLSLLTESWRVRDQRDAYAESQRRLASAWVAQAGAAEDEHHEEKEKDRPRRADGSLILTDTGAHEIPYPSYTHGKVNDVFLARM